MLVSHDRHLIGLVCDRFWRVANGRVEEFDGDLDAYAAWLRSQPLTAGRAEGGKAPQRKPRRRAPGPIRHRAPDQAHRIAAEEIRGARAAVEAALADPALYETHGAQRVAELGFEQASLAREQDALETEWLDLA